MIDDGNDLISIERGLRELEQLSQRGVRIVNDAFKAWQTAKHEYDLARANVHLKAKDDSPKITIPDLEAVVELGTAAERAKMDAAKAEHEYAVKRTADISDRRSSLQTRAKLIMEEMRLAGIGQP